MRCWSIALLFMLTLPIWADPVTLTLPEVVRLALTGNPAVREANERVAAGQAGVDRAQAAREVQLGLSSRFSHLSEVGSMTLPGLGVVTLGEPDTLTAGLGAQKVLYSGGRLEGLGDQARSGARATAEGRERIRQMVTFEAARTFLLLLTAQRESEVAQQALTTAEQQMQVARAREELGTAARYDVLRAEVQAEEARQEVIRANTGIETAQAALSRALGGIPGPFLADGAGLPAPAAPPALDSLLPVAAKQRPDLRALDWQVQGAEAAIRVARSERKPTISLTADYQAVTPETLFALSRWSAGAVASLPLLDGGTAKADLRIAQAQRDGLRAARDSQANAITMEVTQAHARLVSATAQLEVARKRQEQAEEMFRVAGVRFEAGVGTAVEIADAQTTLTRARQGVTRALNDWYLADAELRLALGTPAQEIAK